MKIEIQVSDRGRDAAVVFTRDDNPPKAISKIEFRGDDSLVDEIKKNFEPRFSYIEADKDIVSMADWMMDDWQSVDWKVVEGDDRDFRYMDELPPVIEGAES